MFCCREIIILLCHHPSELSLLTDIPSTNKTFCWSKNFKEGYRGLSKFIISSIQVSLISFSQRLSGVTFICPHSSPCWIRSQKNILYFDFSKNRNLNHSGTQTQPQVAKSRSGSCWCMVSVLVSVKLRWKTSEKLFVCIGNGGNTKGNLPHCADF